ncbi:hypothetical protein REPUB_Repub02eG0048800 [Reevesia pubescens]
MNLELKPASIGILTSKVKNVLTSMYANCGDLKGVEILFEEKTEKSVVSWNTMIGAYGKNGLFDEAMVVFKKMREQAVEANSVTVMSLLTANADHEAIHCLAIKTENLVSLSATISSYAEKGKEDMVVAYFAQSRRLDMELDAVAMVSILYEVKNPAYIDIELAFHGYGLKTDAITIASLLSGCSQLGYLQFGKKLHSLVISVDEGRRYFQIMTEEFGMAQSLQHCASMVAFLSRAGFSEEALLFIRNMDFNPDSAIWGALLNACCTHQEIKLGEYLAKKLYLLDHRNGGLYVLMSNLYAFKGMWDEKVRQLMKDGGGDGCSRS